MKKMTHTKLFLYQMMLFQIGDKQGIRFFQWKETSLNCDNSLTKGPRGIAYRNSKKHQKIFWQIFDVFNHKGLMSYCLFCGHG